MTVYIDADGCPVVRIAAEEAKRAGKSCVIVCDTAHFFDLPDVKTVVVDKGADSADFAIISRIAPGDVVVTQDYALAAMCLSKGAFALNQDGYLYTDDNISALLESRHASRKIRDAGGRVRGPKKRTPDRDAAFCAALQRLLES